MGPELGPWATPAEALGALWPGTIGRGVSETGLGMLSALVQPGIRVPQHGYYLGCWVGSGWCWWWRPEQDVMLSTRGPCGHYQSKTSTGVDLVESQDKHGAPRSLHYPFSRGRAGADPQV